MKNKLYQIRYNTDAKNDSERWKLFENGVESFVSGIVVDGYTHTTRDWNEETKEYKGHISCEGYCKVIDGIAYIKAKKDGSAIKRHLLKTISYRILGTTTTFITSYMFGASIELSSVISIGELIIKPILYFIHERLWYKSKFGLINKKIKNFDIY